MMRSWVCSSSAALVTDSPGGVTGMYSSVPSFSSGMNSEPSWRAGQTVAPSATAASRTSSNGTRSTPRISGR